MSQYSEYTRLPSELLDLQELFKWSYESSEEIPHPSGGARGFLEIFEDLTQKITTSTSFVLRGTYTIPENILYSNFYAQIYLKSSSSAGITTIYFYRNDTPILSLNHTGVTWTYKYGTIYEYSSGDVLNIYIKTNNSGYTAYYSNFRLYGILKNQLIDIDPPDWSGV